MRAEGLLATFPKLVSDSSVANKQHTFAETDTVRFVLDRGRCSSELGAPKHSTRRRTHMLSPSCCERALEATDSGFAVASATLWRVSWVLANLSLCRYVYSPLDSTMYIVLVTNKGSNIIEDLDTLRLLAKVIADQLHGFPMSEESVSLRAFELIFAFDEVIAANGYREVRRER